VLILRFYLQTIHKTKNTKKIIIIKKNTKIKKEEYIPFNMFKTTTKTIKSLPKIKYKWRGEEK
jgi:hypothetical protein